MAIVRKNEWMKYNSFLVSFGNNQGYLNQKPPSVSMHTGLIKVHRWSWGGEELLKNSDFQAHLQISIIWGSVFSRPPL